MFSIPSGSPTRPQPSETISWRGGIDPFTKPASRPRKVFDPYEHKPLSSQIPQIITVHPDYRRGSVGPAS